MQWAVSIDRVDIQTVVMSMSSFYERPQIGHLCYLWSMVGYCAKFRDFKICFLVDPPNYSSFSDISKQDWKYTPYGIWFKELPLDYPEAKCKPIFLTYYFDANLMHYILSGKALVPLIFGPRHPWTGIPKSNPQLRLLHMDLSFFCVEHVFNKPLITKIILDI